MMNHLICKLKFILFLCISVSAFAGKPFFEIDRFCPSGENFKKGDRPQVFFSATTDNRGAIVCGHQEALLGAGWVLMDQFEVFSVGYGAKPKSLMKVGQNAKYRVWSNVDTGLILEKVVKLPASGTKDFSYLTTVREIVKCSKRGCIIMPPICALPMVTKDTQADAVKIARENPDSEYISARLLARALTGDVEAAQLLESWPEKMAIKPEQDKSDISEIRFHKKILKEIQKLNCLL